MKFIYVAIINIICMVQLLPSLPMTKEYQRCVFLLVPDNRTRLTNSMLFRFVCFIFSFLGCVMLSVMSSNFMLLLPTTLFLVEYARKMYPIIKKQCFVPPVIFGFILNVMGLHLKIIIK